jgi:hypothetical protein
MRTSDGKLAYLDFGMMSEVIKLTTPYTLYPIPYTLYPVPYTLHSKPLILP